MPRQISAAVGMAALVASVIVPLYCLLVTPADTLASYRAAEESFGTTLPALTIRFGMVRWLPMLLGWMVAVAIQVRACTSLHPRWWVRLLQVLLAGSMLWVFAWWHVSILHLPAMKMLNDMG